MINQIIKKTFNAFGLNVTRYHKPQKSEKTKRLSFYKTATGDYYLPSDASEDVIAKAIKSNVIFDEPVYQLAKKYIKQDSVVLDVGSNFGQMAIMFSQLVGSGGRVHAFDANDWVFEILKKNIEANNKQSVIIPHFGAVHDKLGEKLIFEEEDFKQFDTYGSYGIDYNAKSGREVDTLTIDSLQIQEQISFMKIDVQGGDLFALKGARETISKNKMPILFEYEYLFEEKFNLNFQEYVDFVHDIDYKFSRVINGHNFLIIPQ